jgi:hypothetical protein
MGVIHPPNFPVFLLVVSSNTRRTSQYPILVLIIVKPRNLIDIALTRSMFGPYPLFVNCVAHYGVQCKASIDEQK